VRILIANEPRVYREVLEQTFAALRPHFEVTAVEPDDLDGAIAHLRPHVVFSSQITFTMTTGPFTWIVLYPEGERVVVLDIAGRQTVTADIEFERLIAIVDETERLLAQTS
jgi:hypothetical protein